MLDPLRCINEADELPITYQARVAFLGGTLERVFGWEPAPAPPSPGVRDTEV